MKARAAVVLTVVGIAAYCVTTYVPLAYHYQGFRNHYQLGVAMSHGQLSTGSTGIDTAIGPDGREYNNAAPGTGALVALCLVVTRYQEQFVTQLVPTLAWLAVVGALVFAQVPFGVALVLACAPPLSFYAHDVTDTLLSAACVLLAATCRSEWAAGLTAGAIPLVDYRVAPLTLLAVSSRRALAAACLPWGLLALYNTACFGAPWRLGQMYVGGGHPWANTLSGLFGWWTPWQGAGAVLFGTPLLPSNPLRELSLDAQARYGLLAVAPWLAAAPLGWLRVRTVRYGVALALSLGTAAVLCTVPATHGRYFVPFIPLWIAPLLWRERGPQRENRPNTPDAHRC